MGSMKDGTWQVQDLQLTDASGRLQRPSAVFRSWITEDGAAGPSGEAGFRAEPGRYHLYVARACP